MNIKKRIGLTMRIDESMEYKETRDAISQDWINLAYKINFFSILIPNSKIVNSNFLDKLNLDGIILTNGGFSNIHKKGSFKKIKNQRDLTEVEVFNFAVKKDIPVFGVCRGMQFIYKYYGGNLKKIVDKSHVAKENKVIFINGKERSVGCYHDYMCSDEVKPKEIIITAFSEDGIIEAIKHKSKKIAGIQWHPERTHSSQKADYKIIKFFFGI